MSAYRPGTELERAVVNHLKRARLRSSNEKRFIRDLDPSRLTDRQADYALLLTYRYRRQIPHDLQQAVWLEWFKYPERLNGFTLTGEFGKFFDAYRRGLREKAGELAL